VNKLEVSTITPVYAGALYLEELVEELSDVQKKWNSEECPLVLKEAIFVTEVSPFLCAIM